MNVDYFIDNFCGEGFKFTKGHFIVKLQQQIHYHDRYKKNEG